MNREITIREFQDNEREDVVQLIKEYEQWLDVDLCFQHLSRELEDFPAKYSRPMGRVFVAVQGHGSRAKDGNERRKFSEKESVSGTIVGCVCLLSVDAKVCEMKRLYVRKEFRGLGIGRKLVEKVLEAASEIGYHKIRLDTLKKLKEAIALYKTFGFLEVPGHFKSCLPDMVFFEKVLAEKAQKRSGNPRACNSQGRR